MKYQNQIDEQDTSANELKKGKINEDTGLPDMDSAEKEEAEAHNIKTIIKGSTQAILIGFGLAFAIYKFGPTVSYDSKIKKIAENDMVYGFLTAYIFARLVFQINMYPMIKKSQVMRRGSDNIRANMFIYKILGQNAGKGAVVLNEEGDVGQYNRANRSMNHFIENSMPVILSIIMNSYTFPLPTFILVCIFAIGRIMHQIGYTKKGYGGHAKGFYLATVATEILNGLLLLTTILGFIYEK